MCTVSWIVNDRSYRLYFNRDEKRSRQRAELPKVQEGNGHRILAPHDGPGGGSWIAVNEWGLTGFLLNNYAAGIADSPSGKFRSRGELPLLIANEASADRAVESIRKMNLSAYRPFYVGVVGPSSPCQIFGWDGLSLSRHCTDIPFLTTSSYRSDEVEAYRRKRYLEMCVNYGYDKSTDHSLSFHQDLDHKDRAFNPLMSRDDAETHCLSVIEVGSERVSFDYYERLAEKAALAPVKSFSMERKGGN